MKILTATEVSRNLSRVLDEMERGGEEIVIMRGRHPVAKMVPGAPRLAALEVLSDLYRTLADDEGESWISDAAASDRPVGEEVNDPWA